MLRTSRPVRSKAHKIRILTYNRVQWTHLPCVDRSALYPPSEDGLKTWYQTCWLCRPESRFEDGFDARGDYRESEYTTRGIDSEEPKALELLSRPNRLIKLSVQWQYSVHDKYSHHSKKHKNVFPQVQQAGHDDRQLI